MYSFTKKVNINASIAQTWRKLSQLETIATWTHLIEKSFIRSELQNGFGVERTCILPNKNRLIETVDEWESEKSLGYKIVGLSVAKHHRESWALKEHGDETMLTFKLEYEANIPIIGAFLERTIFRYIMNRDMTRLVAEFKYYVENGVGAPNKAVLALDDVV